MPTQRPELEGALEASRRASAALRDLYEHWEPIPNAPSDITTEGDRKAQEIILTYLHERFPKDALCAEEATATLKDTPRVGPRLWIVDPIDGTRGFARKNGEFSVMIGFVENGEVTVGVVEEPAKRRVTFASLGEGCWTQDGDRSSPEGCRVSKIADLKEATLVQSHTSKGKELKSYLKALAPGRTIETYSAGVKLALVARGEADLYVNDYAAFSDWDICAGHILVTEAGGRVTGMGGETLRYGLPGAAQTHRLLATNGLLHEVALGRLKT